MQFIGIIPARYQSTRFPGKPLIEIKGKSMINRVYEQATKCKQLEKIFVATDDQRIFDHVKSFGGNVEMTSPNHPSGTDRCAEIAPIIPNLDTTVIVNIQGDEPFIDPIQIELVCECFKKQETEIATLIKKINSQEELFNTNTPKAITDINGNAIYFSRTPLPYLRGVEVNLWHQHYNYYKHIGVYAYKADTLLQLTKLKLSPLEKAESLEQLRWIENGFKIQTAITTIDTQAVDVPQDLQKFN